MGGPRGTNPLDGGAPFYNVYECQDGGFMSVGCLEPQFFKVFLETFLGVLPQDFSVEGGWRPTLASQGRRDEWSIFFKFLEKGFMTNTREYWTKLYHRECLRFIPTHRSYGTETEACVVPVLTPVEAGKASGHWLPEVHPHVAATTSGVSDQTTDRPTKPSILKAGQHTMEVLRESGLGKEEIDRLMQDGALGNIKARL